jgi:hypothetical protein
MDNKLGRLGVLLHDLAGDGVGLSIEPVYEMRTVIGGIDFGHSPGLVVAAWTIRFETPKGVGSYRGGSVAEAVEEAFRDQSAWR